nr:lipopolysaccharide heptosyltransferase II [Desulfobacterales bacterium]
MPERRYQVRIRKRLDFGTVRRILIRSTNWIGDAILTTPAVRAVRRNFPDSEITILARPWVVPVFEASTEIDQIMIYEFDGRHQGWYGKIQLIKELKRGEFELAILFQNAFEAALLAFGASIPYRMGYNTDGRGLFLTHSVACTHQAKEVHEIDYYLGILEAFGMRPDGRELSLSISQKNRDRAREILREYLLCGKRLVGVNPGATFGSAKRWFPERYAALADMIHEEFMAAIVIFGSRSEVKVADRVASLMRHPSVNLCGKTGLGEAFALIQECSLFITNDSGLMHAAAALDVPVIALFGSTDPVTTGPNSRMSKVVRVPTSCSPCLKPVCVEDHRCMKQISVSMVFDHVKEFLK